MRKRKQKLSEQEILRRWRAEYPSWDIGFMNYPPAALRNIARQMSNDPTYTNRLQG